SLVRILPTPPPACYWSAIDGAAETAATAERGSAQHAAARPRPRHPRGGQHLRPLLRLREPQERAPRPARGGRRPRHHPPPPPPRPRPSRRPPPPRRTPSPARSATVRGSAASSAARSSVPTTPTRPCAPWAR